MVNAELAPLFKFISFFLSFAKPPHGLVNLAVRVDVFDKVENQIVRTSYALQNLHSPPVALFNTTIDCVNFMNSSSPNCDILDLVVYDEYGGYSLGASNTVEFFPVALKSLVPDAPLVYHIPYKPMRPVEVDIGVISVPTDYGDTIIKHKLDFGTYSQHNEISDIRTFDPVNAEPVLAFDQCMLHRIRSQGTGSEFTFTNEKIYNYGPVPSVGVEYPDLQYCFQNGGFLRSQFFSTKFMEFYIPYRNYPPGYGNLTQKAIVQVVVIPNALRPFLLLTKRIAAEDTAVLRVLIGFLVLFLMLFAIIDAVVLHFVCRLNPKYQVNMWRTRKTQIKYVMVEHRNDELEDAFGDRITLDEEPANVPRSRTSDDATASPVPLKIGTPIPLDATQRV